MPDTWTFNRKKLKKALQESGAECEVEPRVLLNRDAEWTCHIDLEKMKEESIIGYDIYIHDANEFFISPIALSCFTLVFTLGFLIGFIWRPRFSPLKK